jgi:hypothetical protein
MTPKLLKTVSVFKCFYYVALFLSICIDGHTTIFKFNVIIDDIRTMAIKSILICLLTTVCILDLCFCHILYPVGFSTSCVFISCMRLIKIIK